MTIKYRVMTKDMLSGEAMYNATWLDTNPLDRVSELEAEVARLKAYVDGFDIKCLRCEYSRVTCCLDMCQDHSKFSLRDDLTDVDAPAPIAGKPPVMEVTPTRRGARGFEGNSDGKAAAPPKKEGDSQ